MVTFEKKNYYLIKADEKKNRYYLSVFGSWKSPDEVPKYLDETREAVKNLKKGFTCLCRIDDDKPPKLSLTRVHRQVQLILMDAGVSRTAVYLPKGKVLQKMTLNVVSKFTGMDVKVFEIKEDAEKWLDQR